MQEMCPSGKMNVALSAKSFGAIKESGLVGSPTSGGAPCSRAARLFMETTSETRLSHFQMVLCPDTGHAGRGMSSAEVNCGSLTAGLEGPIMKGVVGSGSRMGRFCGAEMNAAL